MPNRTIHILGIESSCDETAASVVLNGRQVLSNIIASQHDLHRKFGGVVPEIASRAHMEKILPVIEQAMEKAGIAYEQLSAIAVGNRPGLIGSLLVGLAAAKSLAWALGLPLVGVDHVHAHLYAGALDEQAPEYPALGLVVSGGHTSLYYAENVLRYELLGRTIDDAVGEAYDKVASILNIGFPGGPIVDRMGREGDPAAVDFPRTLLAPDSLDFSYSGLKTAVLYHVRGRPTGRGDRSVMPPAPELSDKRIRDICASFQKAAVDVLIIKLQRALEKLKSQGRPVHSLIVGGGVSANSLLRTRAKEFGQQNQLGVFLPRMEFCLDNAAMIAGLGYVKFRDHQIDDFSLEAVATTAV